MTFQRCPRCGLEAFHRTRVGGFWWECARCRYAQHSAACGIGHGDLCCCGLDEIDRRRALDVMAAEDDRTLRRIVEAAEARGWQHRDDDRVAARITQLKETP